AVRVVGGKKRGSVHVECEQIADCVLILAAIETVEGFGPAGVRVACGGFAECSLQPRCERIACSLVRPPSTRRRHRARAKPGADLLPHLSARAYVGGAQRVQGEACRSKPSIMTTDAILLESRVLRVNGIR